MSLTLEEQKLLAFSRAREGLIDFSIVTDKSYEPAWFHEDIANHLEGALRDAKSGKRARIILQMPPRHGKTKLATINFPAWLLGRHPELEVIITTYAQDLASDFGQATKDVMESPVYRQMFPSTLREDAKARAKWLTKEGGGYTAVGVGGPITGKGFNIGIIDDPIKNREEADSKAIRDTIWKWYTSTFLTREEGNGAIIVIMTRWHEDDLVGRILNSPNASEWKLVTYPAIATTDSETRKAGEPLWPERFPLETLLNRKSDLGPYDWSALYQQNPVDDESREFKETWFHRMLMDDLRQKNVRAFVTVDPASAMKDGSDSIGAVLNLVDRENKWHLKSWRLRFGPKELIDWMLATQSKYSVEKWGIEQGVYQQTLRPFLEDEMRKRGVFLNIVELKHNEVSKNLRIRGLIPRYASGSIFHVAGECSELEEELMMFPKGAHDDVVDAAAYQLQIAEAPGAAGQWEQSKPTKPFYPELGL